MCSVVGWVHWGGAEVSKASIERGNAFNQPRPYDWRVIFSFFNFGLDPIQVILHFFTKDPVGFLWLADHMSNSENSPRWWKSPMIHCIHLESMISMINYPASFHGYFCNCLGLPPHLVTKVVIPVARARCCCGGHRMWRGPCHSQRSGYQRGLKIAGLGEHINGIWCVLYIFQSKTNYLADIPSFFGLHFLFLYDFNCGFCIAWRLCFFSLQVLTNSFHRWSLCTRMP